MTSWLKFPAAQYLDQRHPNWVLAEEFGDVKFLGDVVFVHRARAEHIVRLLEAALALPASPGVGITRPSSPHPQTLIPERSGVRWCDIWGWLGILAGAAVLVAAVAVPVDDAALLLALVLMLRGGRNILDAPDLPRGGPW